MENMKPTKQELEKYENWLNKIKGLFGLHDWTIDIGYNNTEEEYYAFTANVDYLNKTMTVILCDSFFDLTDDQKKNTLIHELIHGKVYAFEKQFEYMVDKIKYSLEEQFVNEITKGFENLLKDTKDWDWGDKNGKRVRKSG